MDAIMRESSFTQYIKQQGIEEGIERGIEEGIERGIEEGIERNASFNTFLVIPSPPSFPPLRHSLPSVIPSPPSFPPLRHSLPSVIPFLSVIPAKAGIQVGWCGEAPRLPIPTPGFPLSRE